MISVVSCRWLRLRRAASLFCFDVCARSLLLLLLLLLSLCVCFIVTGRGRPGRRAEQRGHGGVDGDLENPRIPRRETGGDHRQRHHPPGAIVTLRRSLL